MAGSGRRSEATDAAARLADMVKSEGYHSQTWYLMLLDIRDVLASSAPDEEALRDAGEMLAALYRGGRNFSDFYLPDKDPAEQIRKNQELDDAVRTLREATRS